MRQILLASSNDSIVSLLKRILATEYDVSVVSSGEEAIAEIARRAVAYTLLILDGMLPPIRGREVIDQLCEDGCLLPIILMSGRLPFAGQRETQVRVAYLPKPFHPDELLRLLTDMTFESEA